MSLEKVYEYLLNQLNYLNSIEISQSKEKIHHLVFDYLKNYSNDQFGTLPNSIKGSLLDQAFRNLLHNILDQNNSSFNSNTSSSKRKRLSESGNEIKKRRKDGEMELEDTSNKKEKWEDAGRLWDLAYYVSTLPSSTSEQHVLPFILLQDLFEQNTIEDCEKIFWLVEERSSQISNLLSKGRLLFLRISIELLKRLSKSNNTVFCGRILIFLANIYPLSDPSGLNNKGQINTSNITKTDTQEDPSSSSLVYSVSSSSHPVPEQSDEPNGPIDFNFYQTFWSLQKYFQLPASSLILPINSNDPNLKTILENWNSLTKALSQVLSIFESQIISPISPSSISPSFTSSLLSLKTVKEATDTLISLYTNNNNNNHSLHHHHHHHHHHYRHHQQNSGDKCKNGEDNYNPYFTKYLTSSRLIRLQLKDGNFRRQILTQCLIFTRNLQLSLSQISSSSSPSSSNSSHCLQNIPHLSLTWSTGTKLTSLGEINSPEKQVEQLSSIENRIIHQLKQIEKSDNIHYTESLINILHRENNWIKWKLNKCTSFERNKTDDFSNLSTSRPEKKKIEGKTGLFLKSRQSGRLSKGGQGEQEISNTLEQGEGEGEGRRRNEKQQEDDDEMMTGEGENTSRIGEGEGEGEGEGSGQSTMIEGFGGEKFPHHDSEGQLEGLDSIERNFTPELDSLFTPLRPQIDSFKARSQLKTDDSEKSSSTSTSTFNTTSSTSTKDTISDTKTDPEKDKQKELAVQKSIPADIPLLNDKVYVWRILRLIRKNHWNFFLHFDKNIEKVVEIYDHEKKLQQQQQTPLKPANI